MIEIHRLPTPAERYTDAVQAAQDAYEKYRQRVMLGMPESWEGEITVLPEGYANQLTID